MFLGFTLGCSWVFLLLLSSAVGRPTSESDTNYPYTWVPQLLPDQSSDLQSAQQQNPGSVGSSYSPPGASSSQSHAPVNTGSVHPPKAPEIAPRSDAYRNTPIASEARIPASSGSSQSAPRMMGAQRKPAAKGGQSKTPVLAPPLMFQGPYSNPFMMMARAGGKPQFAQNQGPDVRPPAPVLFPGGFPWGQTQFQSFLQEEPQAVLPGPPPPPPSYIIQSRNGYMHVRQRSSRDKYSPDYYETLVDGGDPAAFLGASDSTGGQKV